MAAKATKTVAGQLVNPAHTAKVAAAVEKGTMPAPKYLEATLASVAGCQPEEIKDAAIVVAQNAEANIVIIHKFQCEHKMVSGKRKGVQCDRAARDDSLYCGKHQETAHEPHVKTESDAPRCQHILLYGKSKGEPCQAHALEGLDYCKTHKDTPVHALTLCTSMKWVDETHTAKVPCDQMTASVTGHCQRHRHSIKERLPTKKVVLIQRDLGTHANVTT